MKCCGSPTTSTAAESPRIALTTVVRALLFREILAPMTAGLGPVGELAASGVADRIAGVQRPAAP